MTQTEKRIISGLETILKMRHDKDFMKHGLVGLNNDQKEAFSDIFAAGFMFASVQAFGKIKPSTYGELINETRIPIDERLKVLIAYMKSKADK